MLDKSLTTELIIFNKGHTKAGPAMMARVILGIASWNFDSFDFELNDSSIDSIDRLAPQ
jgi:hypothetical protein